MLVSGGPVAGEELGLFEERLRGFLLLVGGTADEIELIPLSSPRQPADTYGFVRT